MLYYFYFTFKNAIIFTRSYDLSLLLDTFFLMLNLKGYAS